MANPTASATDSEDKDKFSPASKFIALIEYEKTTRILDVTFHSGSKTRYLNVFPMTFQSFKESPTHDAFYSRLIKGRLMSVQIVDTSIGRKESTPLKTVKKEQTLDTGIRKQRAQTERIQGTVARAFHDAALA